jgi:hypothetical protein
MSFYEVLRWDLGPESLVINIYIDFSYPSESSDIPNRPFASHISPMTDKDSGPNRLCISLLTALIIGPMSHARYDPDPLLTLVVQIGIPTRHTGDQKCLEQAAAWLRDRTTNHKHCRVSTDPTGTAIYSSRLLDVTGSGLRVVAAASISQKGALSYVTLSHIWHHCVMPKLFESNTARMQCSIDLEELPLVFQDAVAPAQRLVIPYLWIDALCIVQDDPADVSREVSIWVTSTGMQSSM